MPLNKEAKPNTHTPIYIYIYIYIYILKKDFLVKNENKTGWTAGEEARRQLHKNAACNLEQVLAATPHKTPTVRPPASYHENYSS